MKCNKLDQLLAILLSITPPLFLCLSFFPSQRLRGGRTATVVSRLMVMGVSCQSVAKTDGFFRQFGINNIMELYIQCYICFLFNVSIVAVLETV